MGIINNFFARRNKKQKQILLPDGTPAQGQGGEMAFIDHIEALRWHIIRSVIAIVVLGIVVFINIEWVFNTIILGPAHSDFISYRVLCRLGEMIHVSAICLGETQLQFQSTELGAQFMLSFSSSFMIGFIVAFPYIFWEFWRFIKPALKEQELKYARGIVFWSSLLFFTGVLFAYYIITPFTINFFATYTLSPLFKNNIIISNYYDTMNDLIMGMGIVFELPIVVFFLSRIGILTPNLMRTYRRYAILIIFILASVITPPDWFTIFLVAGPLVLLYEMGIKISARALKQKQKREMLEQLNQS